MSTCVLVRPLDGSATVVASGELDASSSAQLRTALERACGDGREVVVDLSQVTFMDTAAMGVLRSVGSRLREQGRPLVVVRAPARCLKLLRHTGVAQVLDVRIDPLPAPRQAALN